MKKNNRKKGFSLIELIVVIAVIAAIAAVIVPSIGNFSDSAAKNSEKRNVQLWVSTYQQAKAAGAAPLTDPVDGSSLSPINAQADVGGQTVSFTAPGLTLVHGTVTVDDTTNPPTVSYAQ